MATTGKVVEVLFENAIETYEAQTQLLPLVNKTTPDSASLQNSGNVVWRPVQQHAPILTGFDLTGQEQDIIEETYPAVLGTPKNDLVQQRVDKLRDMQFWKKRGEASGKQQATELNSAIASAIALQGSMFYRSNATNGFDFIGEAQALMNERQGAMSTRYYALNDRATLKFAGELSGRETVKGRPEDAWKKGQIGSAVAEFDVFTGSFLPNLAGGASPATTVTGAQSFKPEGGTVDSTTLAVTNIDYRKATIPVADSSGYNVGDKVKFVNGGTDVKALGLADKSDTGQAMTFTIVAKPNATSVTVYPKPIAYDDAALTTLEKQYANIDTQIGNAAVMTRLNTVASERTNLFWDKDSVEVMTGEIPAELLAQLDGGKVISQAMSNGQTMYMLFDGDIATLNFRYRLFTWYGITIADPSRCGVGISYT